MYKTRQGDMWDGIAKTQCGSEAAVSDLMRANYAYILTAVFPAGVELTIPEYTVPTSSVLPPWRQ